MTRRARALHLRRSRGTLPAYFDEWRSMFIDEESVSATLDAVNAALFEARDLPLTERRRVAGWLVARQGLAGAYADTFAGFERERKSGIHTFTGERITSASARHILGEETCRTLRLLNISDPAVVSALELADHNLLDRLERKRPGPLHDNPGFFCCCKCSIGLWRNLLAGGLDRQPERLRHGVRELRARRDGKHRWQGFPFWYTALALYEMDNREARAELRYAAPAFEQTLRRASAPSVYARRHHELARRAMQRI
jgi:hypothetical protein